MGVNFLSRNSSSSFDRVNPDPVNYANLNPNPTNYELLKSFQSGMNLILKIRYKDCANYEGVKVLVFENCKLINLLNQKQIDPHFSDNKKFLSPIARFEPTERGWEWACKFASEI